MKNNLKLKEILLIEDEKIFARTISFMLNKMGYNVQTAYNSDEAISLFEKSNPSIIITDITLYESKLNGIELAEYFSKKADIPIIFFTSLNIAEYNENLKRIKPFAIITKDYDIELLKIQTETALLRYESELERKKLVSDNTRLLQAIDSGIDEIYLVDIDTFEIQYLNKRAELNTGYKKDDLLNKSFLIVQPEFSFAIAQELKKTIDKQYQIRFNSKHFKKTGENYQVEVRIQIIKKDFDSSEYLVISQDISEKLKSSDELRLSRSKLSLILHKSLVIVLGVDKDGTFILSEGKGLERLKMKPGQLNGTSVWKFLENNQKGIEAVKRALTGEIFSTVIETTFGIIYEASFSPLQDNSGEIIGALAVITDITDIIQAQHQTKVNESRLKSLVRNLQAGILVENERREIVVVNDKFIELFSIPSTPELLVGADCTNAAEDSKNWFENPTEFINDISKILTERKLVLNQVLLLADGKILERDYVPIFLDNDYLGHLWQYREVTEKKRTEAALNEVVARLSAILDTAADAIITITSEGIIESVNQTFEKLFGYNSNEIIGKTINIVIPFPYDAYHNGYIKKYIDTGVKKVIGIGREIEAKRKDGTIFPAELSVSEFRIKNNIMFTGILRDISLRRRSEEKLRQSELNLSKAQEVAKVGNWYWEINDNHIHWSDQTYRIFGFEPGSVDISFEYYQSLIHHEDLSLLLRTMDDSLITKSSYQLEHRIILPDGSIKYVLGNGELIFNENGQVTRMFGTIQDVTERKEFEKEIIEAKEKAEEANKAKSIFLANMSHEIRTPLNAVLGFAQLLKESVKDTNSFEYINGIIAGGNALLNLINDILDISKIEAGKMKIVLNQINPMDLFNEIRQIFSQKVKEKNLQMVFDISPGIPRVLLLDETRIRQILLNLVGNAVKFTDKGFITLAVKSIIKDDAGSTIDLLFEVKDTGIGIPKEQIDSIFKAFQQVELMDMKNQGGTGLGLTITKRLVEMMDGKIELESELGKGTSFKIIIRDVQVASIYNAEINLDAIDNKIIQFFNSKVLIVDDNKSNRKIVNKFLTPLNLNIVNAENGKEAVEITQNEKPDLILMDLNMPVMDGVESLNQIRKIKEFINTPVIALTAYVIKEDIEEIKSLFDGYLSKPIVKELLIKELMKYLPFCESDKEIKTEKKIDKLNPHVIDILRSRFGTKINDLIEIISFDEISDLANELSEISNKLNNNLLADISSNLKNYVGSFNVEKVLEILKLLKENIDN
jgi:PAS domain S-box-containing protein